MALNSGSFHGPSGSPFTWLYFYKLRISALLDFVTFSFLGAPEKIKPTSWISPHSLTPPWHSTQQHPLCCPTLITEWQYFNITEGLYACFYCILACLQPSLMKWMFSYSILCLSLVREALVPWESLQSRLSEFLRQREPCGNLCILG